MPRSGAGQGTERNSRNADAVRASQSDTAADTASGQGSTRPDPV